MPAVGAFHDDGIYAVTAKSLAEGRGYRIISLPGAPYQTKYPILFPWLLSLVWRLAPDFPSNVLWLRLVPLAAAAVWLGLSAVLLRRLGVGRPGTATIVLIVAALPWTAFLSTTLLTESLFAALLTASLIVLTDLHEGRRRSGSGLVAGLFAGATMLVRTAGVAAVVAGAAYFVLRRRWRDLSWFVAASAVAVAPWLWWAWTHPSEAGAYYAGSVYGRWNVVFSHDLPEKALVVASNLLWTGLSPWTVHGLTPPRWVLLPLAIVSLALWTNGLRRYWRHPVGLFCLTYGAMTVVWLWPPLRLLAPVAVMLVWLMAVGLERSPARLRAAVAVVMLGVGATQTAKLAVEARSSGSVYPLQGAADDWAATTTLLDWLQANTPPDAVVAGPLDPVYFLYASRRAVRAFEADPFRLFYATGAGGEARSGPLGTADAFMARLEQLGVDYLLMTPARSFGESRHLALLVDEVRARAPGSLTPVAGSAGSGYVVYAVDFTAASRWRPRSSAAAGR